MKNTSDEPKVGQLVQLKNSALGYPMLSHPEVALGAGLVIENGSEEFADTRMGMVKVLWTRTGAKRWEFIEDLIIVEHK